VCGQACVGGACDGAVSGFGCAVERLLLEFREHACAGGVAGSCRDACDAPGRLRLRPAGALGCSLHGLLLGVRGTCLCCCCCWGIIMLV
jgi:hypothetical protein